MLSREAVYQLIDEERAYQDANYDPGQYLPSGFSRILTEKEVTPGIVLLSSYVRKVEDTWTNTASNGNVPTLQQVAKIAAIAVRILERAAGSESLPSSGLR